MKHNHSHTKTEDFAAANGIGTSETTTGSNGYPQGLKLALTDFDTITQAEEIKSKLEAKGHEVEVIELHKRDGWGLWGRDRAYLGKGMYAEAGENDWTVDIAPMEDTHKVALEVIFGEHEFVLNPDQLEIVREFARCLKHEQHNTLTVTVFYDPDQNYRVDYSCHEESTGYSHDTHTYKLGLLVAWDEGEYVVEVTGVGGAIGYLQDQKVAFGEVTNDTTIFDSQKEANEAMQAFAFSDAAKGRQWSFKVMNLKEM